MKKKKFLNGTGLGSKIEPATRRSSAPDGAATGGVELDDDSLASVAAGRYLSGLCSCGCFGFPWVMVRAGTDPFFLDFDSVFEADCAADVLTGLRGQDVSAQMIMDYLTNSGLQPTNADQFRSDWDG